MSQPISKIAWAINVFDQTSLHSQILDFFGSLGRNMEMEVQPVFVLGPGSSYAPHGPYFGFQQQIKDLAQSKFEELRSGQTSLKLKPLEIVVTERTSMRGVVGDLLEAVKKLGCDTILVSSHARKGLSRFFLGSFAETLMLRSTLPLMVVNPSAQIRDEIKKWLFPTDFSEDFLSSFRKVVQLAKEGEGKLTLYYKEPILDDAYLSPQVAQFIQEGTDRRKKVAEEWKQISSQEGLEIQVDFDLNPGPLSSSIVSKLEEEDFDLVVMATQSDPVSNFFLGSLTRQVLRESPCPALVLRVEK